jgi:glycosyltransferase involved in cell wall biosynthesis
MNNNLTKYKLVPRTAVLDKQTSILIKHHRMPGDIIAMTPLIRDLKKTYGDMIKIYIDTPQGQDVWKYNPYVEHGDQCNCDIEVGLDYIEAAENEERGLHISEGFRQDFIKKTSIHIIPSTMWPDIFITQSEIDDFQERFSELKPLSYWVIAPGTKKSIQVKAWPEENWINVIRQLNKIKFIQIGESKHCHTKICNRKNLISLIDKTSLRDLFLLIYFARGTIGYISLHMHIAAAFKKPCLVISGARESMSFYKYPNHWACGTMGFFPCAVYKGCYKGKMLTVKECCGENIFEDSHKIAFPVCMNFDPIAVTYVISTYNKYIDCIPEYNKLDISHIIEPKVIKEIKRNKIFRMICNTCAWGGGERTASRIMNRMYNEGYQIELVDITGTGNTNREFQQKLPRNVRIYNLSDICLHNANISFFHVNDSPWRLHMSNIDDTIDKWMQQSERQVISVNYTAYGLFKYRDADMIICQSEALKNETIAEMSIDPDSDMLSKFKVLSPPANIKLFLDSDYSSRDFSSIHLIRHSSQGDVKYCNDINEQIRVILENRPDTRITLMPPPSFLSFDHSNVDIYEYNQIRSEYFLQLGNVFWYIVPKDKFIEAGCNVVLEALAAGLPILCNDNGGLVDIVIPDIGWICKSNGDMYDIINKITIDDIRAKGIAAKDHVKKIVNTDKWLRYIIGN